MRGLLHHRLGCKGLSPPPTINLCGSGVQYTISPPYIWADILGDHSLRRAIDLSGAWIRCYWKLARGTQHRMWWAIGLSIYGLKPPPKNSAGESKFLLSVNLPGNFHSDFSYRSIRGIFGQTYRQYPSCNHITLFWHMILYAWSCLDFFNNRESIFAWTLNQATYSSPCLTSTSSPSSPSIFFLQPCEEC